MSDNKLYFMISIPEDFQEKFLNVLSNINKINSGSPIKIEGVWIREYSALPKKNNSEDIENGQ